jgi:hypothetical protein
MFFTRGGAYGNVSFYTEEALVAQKPTRAFSLILFVQN